MFSVSQLETVRSRIAAACARAGRRPEEVTLVAVSKTIPPAEILAAYQGGVSCFGENRVQEAAAKIPELNAQGVQAQWHLVGHLQTNKVKSALELFEVIQSVDRLPLAEVLQRRAEQTNRNVEIFAQVNTSGESTKYGVAPHEAVSLARELSAFSHLRLTGLMTIGALTNDAHRLRQCFRTLRELAATIAALHLPNAAMRHLSMGMSDDFEIAIEEGATLVRIGRALFGERQ
jgi:pyridoxal phosphate enzyme (YggS family)